MLIIKTPAVDDAYDESTNSFVSVPSYTIKLEHSLLSLTKWEQKHHKYFLDNKTLTNDEVLDYIKCMTINPVEDYVYDFLSKENIDAIKAYIEDPMTATWFSEDPFNKKPVRHDILTAEVIYSSMIILNIPVELFEKRHLNHLLTLIRVCSENQNADPNKNKKVNEYEMLKRYSEINRQRKAKLGTKG